MSGTVRRESLAIAAGLAALGAGGRETERPRLGGVLKHLGDPPTFDIHDPGSYHAQLVSSFARRGLFYYVYAPFSKGITAWTPRVRYAPTIAPDRGAQLDAVWLAET